MSSLVWERYPSRDTDFTLALALADYAQHDGSDVYPSVDTLAADIGKKRRMVQVLLAAMRTSGFLVVVGNARGGRSNTVRYRIDLDWLKRAPQIARFKEGKARTASAPFDEGKGRNDEAERVQSSPSKGAVAVAPDPLNRQEPSEDRSATVESIEKSKVKRASPTSLEAYLQDCTARSVEAIAADSAVFKLAARKGIPQDFIDLGWAEFKRHHLPGGKRASTKQKDWPATFRNAVDGAWDKLWWCKDDGSFELSSRGREAMNLHRRQAA